MFLSVVLQKLLNGYVKNIFNQVMRVAFIIEDGRIGGAQKYVISIAQLLVKKINVTLIIPKLNSKDLQDLCNAHSINYKLFPITYLTKEKIVALKYILFFIFEIYQLYKYFKSNVEIIYNCGGSWQYKGVLAGKLARKKVIWHLNDTYMPIYIRSIFGMLSPLANCFVHASRRTKEYYEPYIKSNVPEFVITQPIDVYYYDPENNYEGENELISKYEGMTIVGTVANINPLKDIETFIDASNELNNIFNKLVFFIIGPVYNSQKKYYKKLINICKEKKIENVFFLGNRKDIRPLLTRMNIFVCSSKTESGPMTLWEAMSMAKPVVTTHVGDVNLYIKDGVNGYIVDVGDAKTMSQRISLLIKDQDLRLRLGTTARETIVDKFNYTLCAEHHMNVFSQIAENND
jgi:glycosyltransferase involved in cell wall biosynthesis